MSGMETDTRAPKRGLRAGMLATGILVFLVAGAAIVSTPTGAHAWFGRGHHGHAGHGWQRSGEHDPARALRHAEFAVDWLMYRIDGSDEQTEQVTVIVSHAMTELFDLRQRHQTNRDAFVAALSSSEVDRDALDELRRSELELAEVASALLVSALADLSEVLTYEQRQALVGMAQRFRH